MTTFEQIQRQLWDSLMDHERRVFLQLIQDELPTLTLKELGEILTSPAARSVGALPVTSLFGLVGVTSALPASAAATSPTPKSSSAPAAPSAGAAVSPAVAAAPAVAVSRAAAAAPAAAPAPAANAGKSPRRARIAAAKSVQSPPEAPGPRLRPVPAAAPQSPISFDLTELDEAHDSLAVAADSAPSAPSAPLPPRRSPPVVTQLSFAPVGDRSNVDVVRSAMSRTLAQHNRFDTDSLVLNALRSTGWIRAKDLRPHVGLQPDDLRAVLNRLVKSGAIRREGEGPDTVYQVLSGSPAAAAAPGA